MGDAAQPTPEPRGVAGLIIRVMRRFAPGHAAAAEAESREWYLVCPACDTARSYAELGGIRYRARSKGKRVYTGCPACGAKRWHRVERRPAAE